MGVLSGIGVDAVGVSLGLGVDEGPADEVDGAGPGPGVEGAEAGAEVGVRAAALCMNLRFRVDEESPPAMVCNSSLADSDYKRVMSGAGRRMSVACSDCAG